jgi:hypothetical protein
MKMNMLRSIACLVLLFAVCYVVLAQTDTKEARLRLDREQIIREEFRYLNCKVECSGNIDIRGSKLNPRPICSNHYFFVYKRPTTTSTYFHEFSDYQTNGSWKIPADFTSPIGFHLRKIDSVSPSHITTLITEHDPIQKIKDDYTVCYWTYGSEFAIRDTAGNMPHYYLNWLVSSVKGEPEYYPNPIPEAVEVRLLKYEGSKQVEDKLVLLKKGDKILDLLEVKEIVWPDKEKKIFGWMQLEYIYPQRDVSLPKEESPKK